MASEKFRYQLRQEARKWQTEGLISPEIYNQLATRYRLEELESVSRDRFVLIVIGLGFILLGLGVITFVAANWQIWSRPVKVLLLLSIFIVTNCAGFYYWQSPDNAKSRLGQGLLLLGALSMGGNIGLMSQMFHQTGAAYMLYLIWGLGIGSMAYGLRLTSLGLMAIILMAIAYCLGVFQNSLGDGADSGVVLQQMSLIISLLFIPLAYYCRSRWIFGLSSVLIVFSLGTNLTLYLNIADLSTKSFILPLFLILSPSLLWSYRDNLFFPNFEVNFDSINRKLAVCYLGSILYVCSFNFWENNLDSSISGKIIDFAPWSSLIAPTFFIVFSIWAWVQLGTRRRSNLPWRLERNSIYIGSTLLFLFGLTWFNFAVSPIYILGTIIFNLLLFLLAMILISQSVKEGRRFNFWLGILLLILQIFSRMLEYNTGLVLKAISFFGCGAGVILAGLWFERYLRRLNSSNS